VRLILAVLSAGACAIAGAVHAAGPTAPVRSVVLITIDTLRADHLGAYGERRALTPAIDRLAAESVVFEQARSTCPATAPSVASC
jgi:arylsulfatase A-like enzyme